MGQHDWSELIGLLKGVKPSHSFAEGLSDAEIYCVEKTYAFEFPPDLRAFLQTALPFGPRFPNWRFPEDTSIRKQFDFPLQGILFDVEHGVWLPEWGQRPEQVADAKALVEKLVKKAPRLIPVYGHRMIPDRPSLAGNPILSVYQTDIIYYGFDLDDYLRHEFGLSGRKPWPSAIQPIEFWDVDRWQDVRWHEDPE